MALSYKTRRRLSLLILLVGMPLWILLSWAILGWITDSYGRPPVLLELAVYVGLGVLWVLPFRRVFLGVGQADPEAGDDGKGNRKGEP